MHCIYVLSLFMAGLFYFSVCRKGQIVAMASNLLDLPIKCQIFSLMNVYDYDLKDTSSLLSMGRFCMTKWFHISKILTMWDRRPSKVKKEVIHERNSSKLREADSWKRSISWFMVSISRRNNKFEYIRVTMELLS